jgi:hypothetical protein
MKSDGVGGFYKGFGPSVLLYSLMSYPEIRESAIFSYFELCRYLVKNRDSDSRVVQFLGKRLLKEKVEDVEI